MFKIKIDEKISFAFKFEKYCKLMVSILPEKDILGLKEIRFVDKFSQDSNSNERKVGHYLKGQNKNEAIIEINIVNLINANKIPKMLFDFLPEVAALYLSEIVYHEIGHHVHYFKRHNIKKVNWEKFADKYSKAGYLLYLLFHKDKILKSFLYASYNFFRFVKESRHHFSQMRKELVLWIRENEHLLSESKNKRIEDLKISYKSVQLLRNNLSKIN